jgi:hypothetical protein
MDQHEAAAADIAGAWICDCERETDGDGSVNRIAATIENLNTDTRCALFLGNHHPVARKDRLRRRNDRGACDRRDLG